MLDEYPTLRGCAYRLVFIAQWAQPGGLRQAALLKSLHLLAQFVHWIEFQCPRHIDTGVFDLARADQGLGAQEIDPRPAGIGLDGGRKG